MVLKTGESLLLKKPSREFLLELVYGSVEFFSCQRLFFSSCCRFPFLLLELLLEQGELPFGIQSEFPVVYPAEIGRFSQIYFSCRLSFMLSEIDYGFLTVIIGQPARIVDDFLSFRKAGKKIRRLTKFNEIDGKKCEDIEPKVITIVAKGRTTIDDRLKARVCELCGRTDVKLEIHHVNKVKNLKGKEAWEQVMIAKQRKTLAVCHDCHQKIHHGF